jgi:cell division FtsZ-interacting protein ZapD
MMAYVLVLLLALLIFLSISDVVPVLERAATKWERAKDLSKKHAAR